MCRADDVAGQQPHTATLLRWAAASCHDGPPALSVVKLTHHSCMSVSGNVTLCLSLSAAAGSHLHVKVCFNESPLA